MTKKCLMALVIVITAAGFVFAQEHSITVDFGPTIIGAAIGSLGDIIGEEGVSTSGVGVAAQYEQQINDMFSVAGRFAYLGGGMGIAEEDEDTKAVLAMDISSFSLEGHARCYPFRGVFFVDGMLGYANMRSKFSGEAIVKERDARQKESVSFSASRNYIKYGAKLGWRIVIGSQGGFVLEPSFGYYGGVGLGDTLGQKLTKKVGGNVNDLDEMFIFLEDNVFVGGPRLSLSLGWKF